MYALVYLALFVVTIIIISDMFDTKRFLIKRNEPKKLSYRSVQDIFKEFGFNYGRHFGSKIYYRSKHPDDHVVFNANLFYADEFDSSLDYQIEDPIWCGDLNLTHELDKLQAIANEVGSFVVTKEGRYVSTVYARK